ncbi:MAG TPA: hypothetical protein VK815_00710 [Candidatus Acidoferrales bacterium]|jgi:hypothetical protein|nr:hypothetical protein [Candidatus Acidoferrales bacterium]
MKPEKELRSEWVAAVLITAVIVCLHVEFWRHAGALWRDEVNSVNLAQSPSFAALTHDTFPVLQPLLVKGWSALDRSDLWLRLLGMFGGLAIIAAFWAVARATSRPPLFSLVLFGLNLLLIYCGDSLRAYGLGSAFMVFMLAATWSFLEEPGWARARLIALTAVLAVQTLYQNSVLVLAVCLGAFAVCARRKEPGSAWKVLCAGGIAALSLLPYHASLAALPQAAVELRRGFSMFVTNINFESATQYPFEAFSTVWKILAVLVIGFTLWSLFAKKSSKPDASPDLSLFAGVTLISVIALFLCFLWFAAAGARPWYFLPPLALAAACFDFGIPLAQFPRLVRVTAFGLLIGTALAALPMTASNLRGQLTNVDRLADHVAAAAGPQDLVIVTPWYCGISFSRYYPGPAAWNTLPPLADHTLHRYDLVLDSMKDTNSLAPVLDKITATLRSGHRVWIVGQLEWPPDVSSVPPVLPAAPLPGYGWSDLPYMGSWVWRTSYLIAKHSNHFNPVQMPDDGLPKFQENLHLFMAEGWHE